MQANYENEVNNNKLKTEKTNFIHKILKIWKKLNGKKTFVDGGEIQQKILIEYSVKNSYWNVGKSVRKTKNIEKAWRKKIRKWVFSLLIHLF